MQTYAGKSRSAAERLDNAALNGAVDAAMTVHAEFDAPHTSVQIVRFNILQPFRSVIDPCDDYRLDLCLTPRPGNARGCFHEQWGPHRYEILGDLYLIPPRHGMAVRGERGWQASILCYLERDSVEKWMEVPPDWGDRRLETLLDIGNTNIRGLLLRLAEEAHSPGHGSSEFVGYVVGQLAIELARLCTATEEGPVAGGLSSWRLRVIDERLATLHSTPTLEELAGLCNLSVRQLTRGFRTSRGCSINHYVTRVRVEAAKRLLAGDESMKTIAFAVGFSSPSSFAYAFRTATGSTPMECRQRLLRARGAR